MTDVAGNDLTSTKTGRGRGNANFKIDEDIKLASAYVFVTTNAAVGTDQDGGAFWQKIRDSFMKREGSPTRSLLSLKNRFNKVLQVEINKYIGIFHSVLREFHSGWVMIDYVTKAKDVFHLKTGKLFKHDMVYDLLKRGLPKYEISTSTIDARVVRALFLMDSNIDGRLEEEEDGNEDPRTTASSYESGSNNLQAAASVGAGKSGVRADDDANMRIVGASSLVTPRPTIGKKKAKQLMQHSNSCTQIFNENANKKMKLELKETELQQRESRNESLRFLAKAAVDKAKVAREQLKLQIYQANPNSAPSRAYFARMLNKFCAEDEDQSNVADDTFDEEEIDDDDDDIEVTEVRFPRLPDTQRLATSLVNAAATAQRNIEASENEEDNDDDSIDYVAGELRKFLHGQYKMPVLNLNLIKASDFDGDEEEHESTPPPPAGPHKLPPPEDSQLTTG
jgi:hypothetical protein